MTRGAHMSIGKVLCCVVVVGFVLGGALQAHSAQPRNQMAGRGQMGMMAERQKMMADMVTEQKKLDELVTKMNAASGQAKVDQMAAVITELVAQRKAMQSRMMSMQDAMMKQMMPQAQPGTVPPATEPPASTPPPGHEQHN